MKISYHWIKELVPNLTLSAKELAELLTMHSFETVIDREYVIDSSITVVRITKLEQHPNADRLRLATITDGEKEVTVVCGAPNISEGDVVPYAPPGATVYDENREFFTLSEATIRGVQSPGMLNSIRELGISDDHGGIVLLPQDTPLGSKLFEHIASDTILDVDVLPDRAKDASTHIGIAREVAALTRLAVQEVQLEHAFFSLIQKSAGIADMGSMGGEDVAITHPAIAFDPSSPSRVAGIEISHNDVRDILTRLQFTVIPASEPESRSTWMPDQVRHDNYWQVTPPAYRADVLGQHDIIDEVVRMYGLDSIPPSDRAVHGQGMPVSEAVYWTGAVKQELVARGFTETYSYSFEDERFAKLVNSEIHPHVELTNPMAPELKKLRYSMLPGLIGAMIKSRDDMHRTKKGQERALFEIGRVYHTGDGGTVPGVIERPVVAGIAVGDEAILHETIDAIRELFGIEALEVSAGEKPFGKVNFLKYAGEFFGITYEFSNSLLKDMKYRLPVVAFEISMNALLTHAKEVEIPVMTLDEIRNKKQNPIQFTELPKYPSVLRDISMLVDSGVKIDAVEQEIWRIGKAMVVGVDLFDEYVLPLSKGESEGVSDASKSLAFHIEYRLAEKTLTDAEVDETHKKIEHALKKEFEAEVR